MARLHVAMGHPFCLHQHLWQAGFVALEHMVVLAGERADVTKYAYPQYSRDQPKRHHPLQSS